MPVPTPRIASLLPAATDTILALGAGERLVAVSHECDLPTQNGGIVRPTRPRIDPLRHSDAIDRAVRQLVADVLSIYEIDTLSLRDARPDVIVTQTQCDVCAVTPRDLAAALTEWTGATPEIVALAPATLDDAFADMQRIADVIGLPERGYRLVERLRNELDTLAATAPRRQPPVRIAVIEWLDPLMGAGNWIPELVRMAGAQPLFGTSGEHTPFIELEALLEADPDAIVFAPCGFPVAQTMRELPAMLARPGWRSLRAVADGRALVADGNRFFNRPGPTLVGTLAILIEAASGSAPAGEGWRRLSAEMVA